MLVYFRFQLSNYLSLPCNDPLTEVESQPPPSNGQLQLSHSFLLMSTRFGLRGLEFRNAILPERCMQDTYGVCYMLKSTYHDGLHHVPIASYSTYTSHSSTLHHCQHHFLSRFTAQKSSPLLPTRCAACFGTGASARMQVPQCSQSMSYCQ